jgi:hypothetical protein
MMFCAGNPSASPASPCLPGGGTRVSHKNLAIWEAIPVLSQRFCALFLMLYQL